MIPGTISLLDLYSEYGIDLPQKNIFNFKWIYFRYFRNDFPKVNQFIYFSRLRFLKFIKLLIIKFLKFLCELKKNKIISKDNCIF